MTDEDESRSQHVPFMTSASMQAFFDMAPQLLASSVFKEERRRFSNQPRSLEELKKDGFPPEKIREMCLNKQDIGEKLYSYGVDCCSFKQAGVTPSSALGMPSSEECLVPDHFGGFTHGERDSEIDVPDLISMGFTVEELLEDGINEKNIRFNYLVAAGYSVKKIEQLGADFYRIKELFPLEKIIESHNLEELCLGGISATNLISKHSFSELYSAGYSPVALQRAGASAKTLKELGVPAKKLRRGFRFRDYKCKPIYGAWFPVEELKEAEYTPSELKEAKVTAKQMKEVGFSREDLEGTFVGWHLDRIYKEP